MPKRSSTVPETCSRLPATPASPDRPACTICSSTSKELLRESTRRWGKGSIYATACTRGCSGNFFVATTDRGICGLQFFGPEGPEAPLARIRGNFPAARFKTAQDETGKLCESIIDPGRRDPGRTLRLWCKGTNFQIRVWAALLSVPPGALVTYGDIASRIDAPTSARAVGAAVGANPVAALIPCHRVIRAEPPFRTNYRWGAARKLAMIGWEQARASALRPQSISSTSNIV